MIFQKLSLFMACLLANSLAAPSVLAKDDPVSLEQCPAPVQAVIRHYLTQGTLNVIELEKNTKSGGPVVYEAKFTVKDGNRVKVMITPEGKVLQMEQKKPKS